MGLRRPSATKDYEEMPGTNVAVVGNSNLTRVAGPYIGFNSEHEHPIRSDLEMSSVSVVPDGNLSFTFHSKKKYFYSFERFSYAI